MSSPQPIRSLAAIVFTDIVGYSALVNRDDANAMRLVKEHFALVREIAPRFGGKVIKTIGDSVHLEFASAQAATACSIAIQQAHRQRNARVAQAQQFEIRIGLHLGDVEHRDGDIYGDGVNIAARLQPLAPVGGIAISDGVRSQLRLDLRNRFTSRGTPQLKNIDTPVELFVLEGEALAGIDADTTPGIEAAPVRPAKPRTWLKTVAAVIGIVVIAAALWLANKQLAHRASAAATAAPQKSIAVLPFANLSSDKEQEYFSDGIAEDLLNLLSRIETLQVAARTSSFSFKGKDVPIPEIAKALHVANILEGSVRKAGNQVRITARLVRAADGYEIWSQTWDRALDDIFKVQDEIAGAVVSELKVKLLGAEPTAKPVDPRVYPLILQAQALVNAGSINSYKQAVALYRQAVDIAPDEARAWAGIARVSFNLAINGSEPAVNARLAKEAANKALSLDPDNALALGALGRLAADFDLDLPAAARYQQRALALEPGNLAVINSAGILLMFAGRIDEALALFQYRVSHDPANAAAYNNLANVLYYGKRWDDAIDAFRSALRLSPEYAGAHAGIGTCLLLGKHDATAALKEFQAETDEVSRLLSLPMALHALGRTNEADAALQGAIDKAGNDQPTSVAANFAQFGDVDKGFEWLDKAVALRDPYLSGVMVEPMLAPLHGDPRWLPFLRKIGYAPEQLAKIDFHVTLPQQPPAQ